MYAIVFLPNILNLLLLIQTSFLPSTSFSKDHFLLSASENHAGMGLFTNGSWPWNGFIYISWQIKIPFVAKEDTKELVYSNFKQWAICSGQIQTIDLSHQDAAFVALLFLGCFWSPLAKATTV